MSISEPFVSVENISGKDYWHSIAIDQIHRFQKFAESLDKQWEIVGHHTSKSIALPVIRINFSTAKVYIRDNFHDLNVCVVSSVPFDVPIDVLFDGVLEPRSWEWYLSEMTRCREYSWRDWSDVQMETPGLLALSDDVPSFQVKSIGTKSRWRRRMTDPSWYSKDWSSSKITFEGTFGPGTTLWVQERPFMEGIEKHVPQDASVPYSRGCSHFALELGDLKQIEEIIKHLHV